MPDKIFDSSPYDPIEIAHIKIELPLPDDKRIESFSSLSSSSHPIDSKSTPKPLTDSLKPNLNNLTQWNPEERASYFQKCETCTLQTLKKDFLRAHVITKTIDAPTYKKINEEICSEVKGRGLATSSSAPRRALPLKIS